MIMAMAAVALLILLLAAPAAHAAEHVVGSSSGWAQSVDYTTWAAGRTFTVGDTLSFQYGSTHGVDVVSQSDYTSCNTGNAINSYTGGQTTITLNTTGPVYYICPTSGHCQGGMKLTITVVAAATAPSGSTPPSTTTSPPPPPSGCGFVGKSYIVLGLSLVVAGLNALMG